MKRVHFMVEDKLFDDFEKLCNQCNTTKTKVYTYMLETAIKQKDLIIKKFKK